MSISTKNTKVYYATSTVSPSYVEFSPVTQASFPDRGIDEIEDTHLSSTAHTSIPGLEKNDKMSFTLTHSTSNATLVNSTLFGVEAAFKIVWSDGSGVTFEGYICGVKAKADVSKLASWEVEVCVNGHITAI